MDGSPQTDERGYRVLARKYRPTGFDDLVGQEPVVRTLSNAFKAGRIAQAWMLTGVRGVGKTTTARILARALNYEIPGEVDAPTIDMAVPGSHCQAIMEGRHVDVIEMDAASHTGINDIREITDAARYKPVSARYKVYIIDEVHMLSNQAFNGLLKTLEEPPAHVKFIFATTEIRKVPVTVLSRCQRFDLRRIDAGLLVEFLQKISDAEGVTVEADALSMIARAAEGSARDSLSLLDQAIAHGAETVTAETVRGMLGLADRARVIDLFESVLGGDAATALDLVREQYDAGADPAIILADLAEFTHLVTRFKVAPDFDGGQAVTELERERGRAFAETLSMRILTRAWQILLKGVAEVQSAPRALPAADMVLVRLCYAADLPTPDELVRQMREGGGAPAETGSPAPAAPQASGASVEARAMPDSAAPVPMPTRSDAPAARREATASTATLIAGRFGASAALPVQVPDEETDAVIEDAADHAPAKAAVPVIDNEQTSDETNAPAPASLARDEAQAAAERREGDDLSDLRALADRLGLRRDLKLKFAVERQIRPVAMERGMLEIAVEPGAPPDLAARLGRFLEEETGTRWMVVVSRETGGDTLHEIEQRAQARMMSDAAAHPDVAAVLSAFPGARIVDVRLMERDEGPEEAALDDGGENELGEADE
ncbi:MAG: DNA polymerase III subunit gamma/tau [Pseudomonadota bacterium]